MNLEPSVFSLPDEVAPNHFKRIVPNTSNDLGRLLKNLTGRKGLRNKQSRKVGRGEQ